jgi:hypothetical protein
MVLLDARATVTLGYMATSHDPATRPLSNRRAPVVPWQRYADGTLWELTPGSDFKQTPERARKAAITWASRHGMTCHSEVAPNRNRKIRLFVQFVDKESR